MQGNVEHGGAHQTDHFPREHHAMFSNSPMLSRPLMLGVLALYRAARGERGGETVLKPF